MYPPGIVTRTCTVTDDSEPVTEPVTDDTEPEPEPVPTPTVTLTLAPDTLAALTAITTAAQSLADALNRFNRS